MSSTQNGRFITFEGGEGVGKSTNIQFVEQLLKQQGIQVIVTREPGGTDIAEIIREELLKKSHSEPLADTAELLLMFAARAQHIEQKIRPALQQGIWVLCDRFTDSTIAYQGYARGLPLAEIETLKSIAQHGLEPDATFWLDAPIEVGMARAKNRGPADRFEVEAMTFFEKVRQGFSELANKHPERIVKVDASKALDEVQAQLASKLSVLLQGKTK